MRNCQDFYYPDIYGSQIRTRYSFTGTHGRKHESFSQFYNTDKNVRTSPW